MAVAMLHAGIASAKWTRVGENDDMVVYTDSTTIDRSGRLARLWQMNDLKAERSTAVTMSAGKWYLSTRLQLEYDCTAEKVRTLSFAAHAANMGGGKVVLTDDDTKSWGSVTRDSIERALFRLACDKP